MMAAYVSPGIQQSIMDTSRDTSTASIAPSVCIQGSGNSPTGPNSQVELIPHRIFVGGFPSATVEHELRSFFETYGRIREVKIIRSPDGSPKGYGFITFETEEEAQAVRKQCEDGMEFKGRRLNVGPAMRRIAPAARLSDLAVATPTVMLSGGTAYANGGAFVVPEGYLVAGQQGATYAVMVPGQTGYAHQIAYASGYPYSYSSPQVAQQPRYINLPVTNSVMSAGGANASLHRSSVSPEKTAGNVLGEPVQHQTSPRSQQNLHATPQPTVPGAGSATELQQHQTQHTPAPAYYGYSQPLTPITPGYNQQNANFRWPASQVQSTMQYGTSMYSQSGGVYPGGNGYYQMADMTHYSQMYQPSQQDYYNYPDIYGTPNTDTKQFHSAGGAYLASYTGSPGSFHSAAVMINNDPDDDDDSSTPEATTPTATPNSRRAPKVSFPADPVTPERRMSGWLMGDRSSGGSTLSPSPRPATKGLPNVKTPEQGRFRDHFQPRGLGPWGDHGGIGRSQRSWRAGGRQFSSLPNSPMGAVGGGHFRPPVLQQLVKLQQASHTDGAKPQSSPGNRSQSSGRMTPRKSVVSLTSQMNQVSINGNPIDHHQEA